MKRLTLADLHSTGTNDIIEVRHNKPCGGLVYGAGTGYTDLLIRMVYNPENKIHCVECKALVSEKNYLTMLGQGRKEYDAFVNRLKGSVVILPRKTKGKKK